MPIRINLLAEAQALESLRRRDPVKRSIWAATFLVSILVVGSVVLQAKAMKVKSDVNRLQEQINARTSEYQQVLKNQHSLADVENRLTALHKLAANRLLYGNLLDALQHTTIDDVQLVRFRSEQSYQVTDEFKGKTNEDGRVTPARPATSTEKVMLVFDARDSGPNPGDQVNKFKKTISDYPYFRGYLGKTNEARLTTLSPPTVIEGKPSVQFTLECRFAERTR